MSSRECDAEIRRGRLRKGDGFFRVASDAAVLDDSGDALDAVVTLYVHAGIAAADAICCARLGRYSTGENHAEAIGLLATVSSTDSRHLATLLAMKTKAGYSHRPATAADAKRAARAAGHLLDGARKAST